ncbi:MAG: hypothetical protein DCC67_07880 [Planctomycetota bacterium]|nr:MAG: hypothetical protein DCC67_07880 [Planctomycetota bacterium]
MAWTAALVAAAGCSTEPSKIDIPVIDASAAASDAVSLADKNGDAGISKDEAQVAPSLNAEFDKYDADKDGKLVADEIKARIDSWTAQGAKVVPISFYVKMDGRPLAGAKVVLEPEPFMGDVLASAESMVSASGACGPTVPKELLSKEITVGMFCGLYRMNITHPEKSIPAKYNEQTELGLEVAPDYDFFNRKTFELSSK